MYRSVLALAALVIVTTGCRAESGTPTAVDPDTPVAIVGADVIPMDSDRILRRHTVVVQGDRIVAVGPANEVVVPDGAVIVDGEGRFLIPGIAEMHGHIPPPSAPAAYIENVLFLYVANGVTTVRGMLGHAGQLELKERVFSGDILGPALYLAGPSFNGNSVRSPEEAERKARRQAAEGWDLFKIHPGLSRESYDRMAATAKELGMRFGGHVPEDVGLLHALEVGQETFDHLDGYIEHLGGGTRDISQDELFELARKTLAAGAHVVPTMALWESLLGASEADVLAEYEELKYMPADQVRSWASRYGQRQSSADASASRRVIDARSRLLGIMQDTGVSILFGTDAPQLYSVPGFSVHREIERMVDAGLTPYEILVSATRNVGAYFANEDAFGTIAEGLRADLILLSANPLESAANLAKREGVMLRGRWIPESEIQQQLAQIAVSR